MTFACCSEYYHREKATQFKAKETKESCRCDGAFVLRPKRRRGTVATQSSHNRRLLRENRSQ